MKKRHENGQGERAAAFFPDGGTGARDTLTNLLAWEVTRAVEEAMTALIPAIAAEFARRCYAYKQEEERGDSFDFKSAMNAVTYRNIELLQIEESTGESRARLCKIITEDEQWRLWHELSAIIGTIHGGVMPCFRAVQILGRDAVNRALAIPPRKWNLYGIGNEKDSLKYISCRAFMDAVAFHNMEIEQKQRRRKRKAAIDAGTSTADNGKKKCLSRQSIPQKNADVKQETAAAPRRRRTRKQSNE